MEHSFCNVFLVSKLNSKCIYHCIYRLERDYECDLQRDFFPFVSLCPSDQNYFFKKALPMNFM